MLRIFKQYYPIRNALFVFGEGLFIYVAVILSCWIKIDDWIATFEFGLFLKAFLITAVCQVCLYYNDLYNLEITDSFLELGIRLMQALGVAAIILGLVYFIFPFLILGEGVFVVSIALAIFFLVSWRIGYTQILNRGLFNQKIIIIGSSDLAKEIVKNIMSKTDSGYEIGALIGDNKLQQLASREQLSTVNQESYDSICDLALEKGIKTIVVALKEKRGAFPANELLGCRVKGIDIIEGSSFYEMLTGKLIVEQINPSWLIFSHGFQKTMSHRILKRLIDLTLSTFILIVLFPIILMVAIIIKLDSRGPVFFSQERVGEGHRPYMVHKFRSMCCDAEKDCGPIWAKENDDRITRVGIFIRKWRIDEIPQLWNVLKGDMSFVGPRPERGFFVDQLTEIIPYYRERFSVKPGITGWAQVSYGYGATVEDAIEKLNYDLFYIKNMSILMDLMIVGRTVKTVIFGHGR